MDASVGEMRQLAFRLRPFDRFGPAAQLRNLISTTVGTASRFFRSSSLHHAPGGA